MLLPILMGQHLVKSGSIAAGDNKLDYTNNAFIEFGVDISAYHCNHKIVVTDSAGKSASGFLHSVAPGGETLGDDLLSGWDFSSGWSKVIGDETILDADSFSTASAGGSGLYKAVATQFACYYFEGSGSTTSGGGLSFHIIRQGSTLNPIVNGGYATAYALAVQFYCRTEGAGTTDITSLLLKRLTDCAATGALIVSTLGGSTRSWTSVDTGFNPNLACTYAIYRVR